MKIREKMAAREDLRERPIQGLRELSARRRPRSGERWPEAQGSCIPVLCWCHSRSVSSKTIGLLLWRFASATLNCLSTLANIFVSNFSAFKLLSPQGIAPMCIWGSYLIEVALRCRVEMITQYFLSDHLCLNMAYVGELVMYSCKS